MSKYNYEAHPQWEFPFHAENVKGFDRLMSERLHKALLNETLENLRNGNVSQERKKAHWEWLLDCLVRDEALAGTFKACCACTGHHAYTLLAGLAQMHEAEVDKLFGEGMTAKIMAACDEATDFNEENLAAECATHYTSPRGAFDGGLH